MGLIKKIDNLTISESKQLVVFKDDIKEEFLNTLNNIFNFEDHTIKIVGDVNEPYFRIKDVLKILDYSYNKDTIKKYIQNNIPKEFKKSLLELVQKKIHNNILKYNYNELKEIYINKEGLENLLIKTKKPINKKVIYNLINKFNINLNIKYTTKEQNYLNCIIISFSHLKYKLQYSVFNRIINSFYYIDLYFPDYKLAIECDEFGHKNYNKNKELERQNYLENELNCTFIRFNPDENNFCIFEIIQKINYFFF